MKAQPEDEDHKNVEKKPKLVLKIIFLVLAPRTTVVHRRQRTQQKESEKDELSSL